MNLVRNERLKLSAAVLNTIAVTIISTGRVAPFCAFLYGSSSLTADQVRFCGLAAPGWVVLGAGLHLVAGPILGGLRD